MPPPVPAIPLLPAERSWGFTVQLYSVRSRQSWGHGDLRDLAELAAWSARELGADFVLVNPLHAAEPGLPVSPSPYLPVTRMFTSPLYLRVEDIPEFGQLAAADRDAIADLAAPLQARSARPELIDRDAVWRAKRAALELVSQVPRTPRRQAEFDRFRADRGGELEHWAAWCALAEIHGPDWRSWPARYTAPDRGLAAVAAETVPGPARRVPFLAAVAMRAAARCGPAAGAAGGHAVRHHSRPGRRRPGGRR